MASLFWSTLYVYGTYFMPPPPILWFAAELWFRLVRLSVRAFGVVAFSDRIAIDDYFKTSYGHMVTLKTHDLKMTDKENYLSGKCNSGK